MLAASTYEQQDSQRLSPQDFEQLIDLILTGTRWAQIRRQTTSCRGGGRRTRRWSAQAIL